MSPLNLLLKDESKSIRDLKKGIKGSIKKHRAKNITRKEVFSRQIRTSGKEGRGGIHQMEGGPCAEIDINR